MHTTPTRSSRQGQKGQCSDKKRCWVYVVMLTHAAVYRYHLLAGILSGVDNKRFKPAGSRFLLRFRRTVRPGHAKTAREPPVSVSKRRRDQGELVIAVSLAAPAS